MKLQQLRYVLEVYRHNLNVSEAADALFTSQPGVSKQIRLLEEELGVQIFTRSGKRMVAVTPPGQQVLQTAERILHDIQNIKNIGKEFTGQDDGVLTIATTHTQARYVLPEVVAKFVKKYPKVRLNIRQGCPETIVQMTLDGEADFSIATELLENQHDLCVLPCSRWDYGVLVPNEHPLLDIPNKSLNIQRIAEYPLITYEFAFQHNTAISRTFHRSGISPNCVVLQATDSDVLKTYVQMGLGVGIMAKMAFHPQIDRDLMMIDASHLFDSSHTGILLRPDTYFRSYIYDFIELYSPELNRQRVEQLLYAPVVEDFSI